jgi:prophage antirepressor-like protein
MSQVQLFSHPELGELKATIKNGEPWFLAGDVCRVLGIKNSSKAVSDIESKFKNAGLKGLYSGYDLIKTAGGQQKATIINEQILYELIFNSRKQKAVLFRAWVTGEVLPSIRKHGFYRTEGKMIRRVETDAIKEFIEYAKNNGSQSSERYYAITTKATNEILGIEAGKRDELSAKQLEHLAMLERVIASALTQGIEKEMNYKDIYKLASSKAKQVYQVVVA